MPHTRRFFRLAAASAAALAVLAGAVPALAQGRIEGPPRFRLGLNAGWGHSFAEWASLHHSLSSAPFFFRVEADNTIASKAKSAAFAGGSLTFAIGGRMRRSEFQAGFGYLKSPFPSDVSFQLSYIREVPGGLERAWTGTGEITSVPLYVNFVNRYPIPKTRLAVVFFLGPALFLNSALAESFGGAPAVAGVAIDAIKVPVVVQDKTWVGLGGDIGAGLEMPVGRNLELSLEAAYFYCPRKALLWKWTAGTYDGVSGGMPGFVFDETAALEAGADTTNLTVKPSFLAVSLGLKILFR